MIENQQTKPLLIEEIFEKHIFNLQRKIELQKNRSIFKKQFAMEFKEIQPDSKSFSFFFDSNNKIKNLNGYKVYQLVFLLMKIINLKIHHKRNKQDKTALSKIIKNTQKYNKQKKKLKLRNNQLYNLFFIK